jgi:hypothetical protein
MIDRHRVLEELVDDEDFDRLLSLVTLDEVAMAWCSRSARVHASSEDDDDPDWWAVALFFSTELFRRRDLYRSLLLKLVEHATDPVLGHVGAGPLENFVSDDEDDLVWLEQKCAMNSRLRTALSGVWCGNEVSAHTLIRLDRAAGVELRRPTAREQWPPERTAYEAAKERLIALAGDDWQDWIGRDDIPSEIQAALVEYMQASLPPGLDMPDFGDAR